MYHLPAYWLSDGLRSEGSVILGAASYWPSKECGERLRLSVVMNGHGIALQSLSQWWQRDVTSWKWMAVHCRANVLARIAVRRDVEDKHILLPRRLSPVRL